MEDLPGDVVSTALSRPKLSFDGQVEHLARRGVRFELTGPDEAREYLADRMYFFKVKAYEKDFPRDGRGMYLHLDFAYLQDLVDIDACIRGFVLDVFPMLEHHLKVDLNRRLCEDEQEDGYAVVRDFLMAQLARGRDLMADLERRHVGPNPRVARNRYTGDMFRKYQTNPAYWNFMEVLTFGDLKDFYAFCADRTDGAPRTAGLLFAAGRARNAAAHGNCLLDNVYEKTEKGEKSRKLRSLVAPMLGVDLTEGLKKTLSISSVQDLMCVLLAFLDFVRSRPEREKASSQAEQLAARLGENIGYYRLNPRLERTLANTGGLLRAFAGRCIAEERGAILS